MAMAPVPIVWFVRKFKIIKMEPDIPVVSQLFKLILSMSCFVNNVYCCQLLSTLISHFPQQTILIELN